MVSMDTAMGGRSALENGAGTQISEFVSVTVAVIRPLQAVDIPHSSGSVSRLTTSRIGLLSWCSG